MARTPDAWPAGRDPDGAELLMMSELHLAAGRRGAASAVPPAAMRPARVATLVCVLTSSLPGVLAQTCVPAAPPAGYISDAAAPATATTVAALGTITCGTGYFSMSTPNGPACAADGNPFVWTGCDPCHTMAHVFEWGGGTCNCDVAFYGTASTDATGTTDCHPCLVNSGTAPPPPGVARTDNTNPSSCHCVEGYSIGDGNAQVPQHWERSCSVSAGETHRSRVNACKSAGPPLDSYAFSGTAAECSAAHSACVFAVPETCTAVPCPQFSAGYAAVWDSAVDACTCFSGYFGLYLSVGSTTHPVWQTATNSYISGCAICTPVANADPVATHTCTTALDSRVSACDSGYFKIGGSVGTADLCPGCTVVGNAATGATYMCTTAADSRVSGCASGFYKIVGGTGAADSCPACSTVLDSETAASYTCTSSMDSRVSGCAPGFYKIVGAAGAADSCPICTTVADAAVGATYTCSISTDSRVSSCLDGFFRSEGASGVMDTCTGCTPQTGCLTSAATCCGPNPPGHTTELACTAADDGYYFTPPRSMGGAVMAVCTAVLNSVSITCPAESNSRAVCQTGYYNVDNSARSQSDECLCAFFHHNPSSFSLRFRRWFFPVLRRCCRVIPLRSLRPSGRLHVARTRVLCCCRAFEQEDLHDTGL